MNVEAMRIRVAGHGMHIDVQPAMWKARRGPLEVRVHGYRATAARKRPIGIDGYEVSWIPVGAAARGLTRSGALRRLEARLEANGYLGP